MKINETKIGLNMPINKSRKYAQTNITVLLDKLLLIKMGLNLKIHLSDSFILHGANKSVHITLLFW